MSTTATEETNPSAGAETRRLGRNALVYLLPTILVRGLSIFLTPLYTRRIDPAGYAIISVANAVTTVLGICFGMALNGCITRLYVEYADDPERRRDVFGTILMLSVAVPLALVGIFYLLGNAGLLDVFANVHFYPHLQLVIWTSLCGVFLPLPSALYGAAEEPRKVAILSTSSAVVQVGLTLLFVVGLNQGPLGVLRANLFASIVGAVPSVALFVRHSRFRLSFPGAWVALAFSLPLVPHLVGNWVLSISDRLVLDKYVSAADVGRYSLGYILSLMVTMVAMAVGQALVPMAMRQLKDPEQRTNVPQLGTYSILVIVAAGLSIALAGPEALRLLAPASYGGAISYVPWVVLGAVFQGVYLVSSIGTWFSMRTKWIPLITLVCAALNIAVNVIFIPRYGAIVAAVSTAGCYAVSAVLHGLLAHRLHPIDWELRRWFVILGVALAWYAIGSQLPLLPIILSLVVKASLVLLAFPATLLVVRFFTPREVTYLRSLTTRFR